LARCDPLHDVGRPGRLSREVLDDRGGAYRGSGRGLARIGRRLGAEVVPEGAELARLLAPAAALRVARQVELAARREVGAHIRRAREDGQF